MREVKLTNYVNYACQRVLKVIREKGKCFINDFNDLAKEFQVQVKAFQRYLRILEANGLVESSKVSLDGTSNSSTIYFIKGQVPESPGLLYEKYVHEKILTIIQANEGCHFGDILSRVQMSKPTLRKYLNSLKDLGLIKAIGHRHRRYFTRDGKFSSDKPLCTFCGTPILNKPRVFNIFFPSGIYCNKYCKDKNAPKLSEANLQKVANKIDELRKLEENGKILPFKSKVQNLRDEILNVLKEEARQVSFQELIKLIGLRKHTNEYCSDRWMKRVLHFFVDEGKINKTRRKGRCYYWLPNKSKKEYYLGSRKSSLRSLRPN